MPRDRSSSADDDYAPLDQHSEEQEWQFGAGAPGPAQQAPEPIEYDSDSSSAGDVSRARRPLDRHSTPEPIQYGSGSGRLTVDGGTKACRLYTPKKAASSAGDDAQDGAGLRLLRALDRALESVEGPIGEGLANYARVPLLQFNDLLDEAAPSEDECEPKPLAAPVTAGASVLDEMSDTVKMLEQLQIDTVRPSSPASHCEHSQTGSKWFRGVCSCV